MRALLYCAGGGIGDSLVASVVGRALRRRYDVVDALTLPAHRATLERVPDLDDVLVDEGEDLRVLADALFVRSYDACVVTWATSRTARVPQLAGIATRVGQARRIYSFRFTKKVPIRSETGDVTSHWSDILLDYARAIGCDTSDRDYRFVPTAEDESETARLAGDDSFIILNPCNAVASKRGIWPVDGWAKLALQLQDRYGGRVLVSGSPADAPVADAIVSAVRRDSITSIAGRLGIGAFGALAQRARAFVGITTGSMHVAASVGCPTVGIFPFQTDYPDRWAPLGARTAIVRPSYPCHKGDTKEKCRDYACVAHLDETRILAAAESVL
ncbi:MAG TPA: glycosyltransferase family 9 protein [Candidatus Baltobacteraceae bacterium]|nr:glycosyltransferase family 9 protein [Candidatus Baltobacteraceae bacterium]